MLERIRGDDGFAAQSAVQALVTLVRGPLDRHDPSDTTDCTFDNA